MKTQIQQCKQLIKRVNTKPIPIVKTGGTATSTGISGVDANQGKENGNGGCNAHGNLPTEESHQLNGHCHVTDGNGSQHQSGERGDVDPLLCGGAAGVVARHVGCGSKEIYFAAIRC